MKLYPQDIEQSLGFDQIRKLLISCCQSERGVRLAEKARPTSNYSTLQKWLSQVSEMIKMKQSASKVHFEFPDIDDYLKKIEVPGSFIDPTDFHQLKTGIRSIVSWGHFLNDQAKDFPELSSL
jgi:DNA mismatch repair protein MutS2